MTILKASDDNPLKEVVEHLYSVHGSRNTDKGYHGYTRHYELLFRGVKDEALKILEIGIGETAAGLDMFGRYFPNAKLFGIDIIPSFKNNEARIEGRLKIFIGDQKDDKFLAEVMSQTGKFDIIIDDGGHYMDQQMFTLQALYPWVVEGGAYVIEDLFSSYEGIFVKDQKENTVEYLKHLLDLVLGRPGRTLCTPQNDFERYFVETVDVIVFVQKMVFIFKK